MTMVESTSTQLKKRNSAMSSRLLPIILLVCMLAFSACSSGSNTVAANNTGNGAPANSIINGSWSGSYAPPPSLQAPAAHASLLNALLMNSLTNIDTITAESFDFQITFIADNGSVSGSYNDSKGRLGSISGTLSGMTLDLTITLIGTTTESFDLDGTVTLDGSTGLATIINGTINNAGTVVIDGPDLMSNIDTGLVGTWQVPDGAGTTDDLDRDGLIFKITEDGGTWDVGSAFAGYGVTWTYSNNILVSIAERANEKLTLTLHPTNSALMIRKDYTRVDEFSNWGTEPVLTIHFVRLVNPLPTVDTTDTLIHTDLGAGIGALGTDITTIYARKVGDILTITVNTNAAPIVDESISYSCAVYANNSDNDKSAQLEYRSNSTLFYDDSSTIPPTVSAIASGNSIIFTFDLSIMTLIATPLQGAMININARTSGGSPLDRVMNISVNF